MKRTVMAKQLKCIVFTTLVIIVFMIAMPIFIMKPKVSATGGRNKLIQMNQWG